MSLSWVTLKFPKPRPTRFLRKKKLNPGRRKNWEQRKEQFVISRDIEKEKKKKKKEKKQKDWRCCGSSREEWEIDKKRRVSNLSPF